MLQEIAKEMKVLGAFTSSQFLQKLLVNNNLKFQSIGSVPTSKLLKLLFIPKK